MFWDSGRALVGAGHVRWKGAALRPWRAPPTHRFAPPHTLPARPQHSFLFKEDTVAHAAIKDVISIYKHPIWLDGRPVDTANFNTASDGYLSAMLLTDSVITKADIDAANK